MSMQRYMTYRDSGAEWIGEIPEGWKSKRLKYLASSRVAPTDANEGDYLGLDSVQSWTMRICKKEEASADGAGILYDSECVLFGKLRPYLAKVALPENSGPCSSEFLVLMPKAVTRKYLAYLLSSESFIDEVNSLTYGVRMPRAGWDLIGNIQIPVPPAPEQQAIINYLDFRTAEIDSLVADCEREVGLLQEYRKAVITEVITKGLDPDVPMKDSGVEWIGVIPEGWLVRPAKTLFVEGRELRRPNDEQCTASQKYGIIPQAQYTALENQRMVAADKNLDAWKHVEPGDFVISLRSFQGGLELSTIAGCVTWHYIVLQGNCLVESAYYKYLFKTRKYIESLQRTCTYIRDGQDLRYSNFVQVPLLLPPRKEQIEIGAYLDAKTAEIDSLIDAKQSMADKLREYRKSLVSEAVTGKFKVPGA